MPNHYKKKKKMPKKHQKGGQKKRAKKKMCRCSGRHSRTIMKGGSMLTPAQMKMLQRPVRKFSTLPVNPKMTQQGMGCGHHCSQCGGNIFDSIGSAFKRTFSNPLRGLAAVSTMGLSETFLQPAELIGKATGTKTSKLLEKAVPVITAVGSAQGAPSLGRAAGLTAKGLKMMGLGKQPMLV